MSECDLCAQNEARIELLDVVRTWDLCQTCHDSYFADSVGAC